jgi:carbonic anhydrase
LKRKSLRGTARNGIVFKADVERGGERLRGLDPILTAAVKKEQFKVVGATYELRAGQVALSG